MESVLVEKRLGDEGCLFTGQISASASADASALVVAAFLDSTRQWLPAGHCAVHVQSLQQRWSHL